MVEVGFSKTLCSRNSAVCYVYCHGPYWDSLDIVVNDNGIHSLQLHLSNFPLGKGISVVAFNLAREKVLPAPYLLYVVGYLSYGLTQSLKAVSGSAIQMSKFSSILHTCR